MSDVTLIVHIKKECTYIMSDVTLIVHIYNRKFLYNV